MLTLILLLLLTTLAFWNFFWKRRSLPPGPTPLPFFGNTLALKNAKSLYEPFRQWTREFGPVYTFWMGEDPVVMVTGYEQMRDMFVKDGDTFAGRHFMVEFFKILTASKGMHGGVIRTEGEPWKVIRRFGLQAMRNLGVGKASLECQYLSDIGALVGRLRAQLLQGDGRQGDEQEMNLQPHIDRLIGSTINRLLFGYGFDEEQLGEYYELKAITGRQVQLMMTVTGKMLVTRPALRHLPVFSATFAAMDANVTEVFNFLSRPIIARVAERQKKLATSAEEPRDLLDHFLDQMESAQQKDPEMAKYFTLDTLPPLCFDLFLAGQETTSLTLCFLVLYLLLDQRVQAKLHAELDRLEAEKGRNGFDDQITMADRPKLPYLGAVINESQRLCNLLPINLGHRTMADVDILEGKFRLKKGTIIVPQISTVLLDEKIFPNPHRFSPERFLDEQGQLKRCEQLIPFSLGKRICMGESLARLELFLFTANFFRNFQVLPADPLNPPSAQPIAGFSVRPSPYNCRLVIREKAVAAD